MERRGTGLLVDIGTSTCFSSSPFNECEKALLHLEESASFTSLVQLHNGLTG